MAESEVPHLLVIPFPAQGHMLPLLDLARLLSLRGIAVTIVTTPKNLPLLSPYLSTSPLIQPLLLPFPDDYPNLPPGVENARGLPHSTVILFAHALSLLQPDILTWAKSTIRPPDAVIADFFLGWTSALACELSIPRIVFSPSGAFCICLLHCLWRDMPRPDDPQDVTYCVGFPSVPNAPSFPWREVSSVYRAFVEGRNPFWEFIKEGFVANVGSWGIVLNTVDEFEGVYLDHLRRDLGHERVWAVGPLNFFAGSAGIRGSADGSIADADDQLRWLNGRESGSVVYVCFGTQTILSGAQMVAVAAGLEKSGVDFVWCVKESPDTTVPEGFQERLKDRGLVIKGWAPQVEILNHESVGWFLTHCGWNSVLEGIGAGVAMLMWPMGADQFVNARLLEEEMRIGIRVCGGPDTVPNSNELGRMIAESVNGESEERVRAVELKRKEIMAVAEGGSSYNQVERLVEALSDLKFRGGAQSSKA